MCTPASLAPGVSVVGMIVSTTSPSRLKVLLSRKVTISSATGVLSLHPVAMDAIVPADSPQPTRKAELRIASLLFISYRFNFFSSSTA